MAFSGTNRVRKIVAIAVVSLLAIAVAAAAVMAGIIESSKPASSITEIRTQEPQPTMSSKLEVVRPTAKDEKTRTPAPAPTLATSQAPPRDAISPEVVETVQARVPASRPTVAPEPTKACPSGVVVSGMTDVTVTGQREWIVGHLVDLLGHGSIHNGTTAAVDISLYLPYIQGLDAAGRTSMNSFTGDFDYNPPPGTPRPGTLSLPAGQTLTYTFSAKEVSSDKMREIVAWYTDPQDPVWNYSDIQVQIACPDVTVTAPPGGPNILNTYGR
jgi:hypothetical protein